MARPSDKDAPAREQWATSSDEHRTDFAKPPSPRPLQAAAWALWLAGLVLECLGVLVAVGALRIPVLSDARAATVVVALAVDLALVIAATVLNKKAAALKTGRRGQGVLPAVMATAAFVPTVLFFATSKNATARVRLGSVVAALVVVAALAAVSVGRMLLVSGAQ